MYPDPTMATVRLVIVFPLLRGLGQQRADVFLVGGANAEAVSAVLFGQDDAVETEVDGHPEHIAVVDEAGLHGRGNRGRPRGNPPRSGCFFQSRLCLFRDRTKGFDVVHRDIREHFAVYLETRLGEAVDEPAIGKPVDACRGIDARDPERTEFTLLLPLLIFLPTKVRPSLESVPRVILYFFGLLLYIVPRSCHFYMHGREHRSCCHYYYYWSASLP